MTSLSRNISAYDLLITTVSTHIVGRFVGVVGGKTVLRESELLAKVLPVRVTVYSHAFSTSGKGTICYPEGWSQQLATTMTNVVLVTKH